MNLDFGKGLFKNKKDNNLIQNFMNEISEYLRNNLKAENILKAEMPIIEKIISENNVTIANENSIRWGEDDVLINYAKKNSNEPIYFVKDSRKTYWSQNKRNYDYDYYTILEIKNNRINKIELNKKDMPQNISVNDILKIEKNEYIVDYQATKEVQQEIINMANEILNKQNNNLNNYRKEGHVYLVTEEINNNIFLKDLTENNGMEFEETEFPKELLEKATEGAKFKYIDGKYEYIES